MPSITFLKPELDIPENNENIMSALSKDEENLTQLFKEIMSDTPLPEEVMDTLKPRVWIDSTFTSEDGEVKYWNTSTLKTEEATNKEMAVYEVILQDSFEVMTRRMEEVSEEATS